ncbi:MAG TPA: XRE family transcriptional regulator, partial [Alteromonas sp.]|nr:XRE family transcriptional regulator [Alteromonas sp.]
SEVTIRKDLTLLAEQGRLIRQHGGAAPLNKPQPATNTQLSLKQAIGQLAAS